MGMKYVMLASGNTYSVSSRYVVLIYSHAFPCVELGSLISAFDALPVLDR